MHYRIDSLRGLNPLNSSAAKGLFYVFHILPEWLAVCVLFSENVRKTFGTGLFGDWKGRDETEKEKKKRLEKSKGDVDYGGEKGKNENDLVVVQGSV